MPGVPPMGSAEGKILAIDTISQNRLNTIKKKHKFCCKC